MTTRDPEAKRRRLLEAALTEFAEYGIAGARVDRLVKRAGVSAGLVYSFCDGKAGLFEAVYEAIVDEVVEGIPIDATDLAEYAGRLYDASTQHPEVMRFMSWYALERSGADARPSVVGAMKSKVAAIADAQQRGLVSKRLDAGQLLMLIIAIANMWQREGAEAHALVTSEARRTAVIVAVQRLASVD